MKKLRTHIADRLDAIKPRVECVVCRAPTRADDWLCPDCHRKASTSANKQGIRKARTP